VTRRKGAGQGGAALLVLSALGIGSLMAPACATRFSSNGTDTSQGGESSSTGGKGGKGGTSGTSTGGTLGDAGDVGTIGNAGTDVSGGSGGKGGTGGKGGSANGGSSGARAMGGTTNGGTGGTSALGGSGGDVTPLGGSGGDVTPLGGSGGMVGGGGAGKGGSAGTAGVAGAGGAGKGGTSGGAGKGGSAGTAGVAGAGGLGGLCMTKVADPSDSHFLYRGSGSTSCGDTLDSPYSGVWRALSDGTTTVTAQGQLGGRSTDPDCAMRAVTSGHLTEWGGGQGFGMNMQGSQFCLFDASAFTGLRFYIKGATGGSAGDDAGNPKANTVRVAFATQATTSVAEGGSCAPTVNQPCDNHFGGYCSFANDSWTNCGFTLSDNTLTQLGVGPDIAFDKSKLLEVLFEVRRASSATQLSFDFVVDDVELY